MIQEPRCLQVLEQYPLPDIPVILDPSVIHVIMSSQVSGDKGNTAPRHGESYRDGSLITPHAIESGPYERRFNVSDRGEEVPSHKYTDHDAL